MSSRQFFDRTTDVPKIIGCNVRSVEYRWDIYSRHLAAIPDGAEVLDFGAGSLRETFDLAERGFLVTAVDMNITEMQEYANSYDWRTVKHPPKFSATIPESGSFSLVTAFDAIEHLADPASVLARFHTLLTPNGMLFVTVPNGRTPREIVTRLKAGRGLEPGEAHLQFKSPRGWRRFFEQNGFSVLDHDMAIGPLTDFSDLASHFVRQSRLHKPIAPILNGIDRAIKPLVKPLFGWNLIVMRKT